mmetsp:Transcript_13404/g.39507  ORF Transcript_13404/g.39507 Transcript_13404/m.39507 type:complete len:233 (+) Transcript_13404:100-798(+)|eukprot:CAMPEP_0206050614 /NCGR_PEP_ID=MMETSP1466-20131121/29632_1 /ASSEMBLY_ACC=CAM_ASM_001126 /TAXON_ID=44452 /ORGANISM="Pavlova gyrans, Strain CCMP608" /LENGTH=232 /DNA_ID=CAMNT_0053425731 /DNA_START=81 /DNA_END=779 /DNA_ORIENTATION=+
MPAYRNQSFNETSRVRPHTANVSHRTLTPTLPLTDEQLRAREAPRSFLDGKWPVPEKVELQAGASLRDQSLPTRSPIPTGMRVRPKTAQARLSKPKAADVSFLPYRTLPMPEPLPGDWNVRSQYQYGAFQLGVIKYPYTLADKLAAKDLEGVIHRSLDHPVIPLTMWNGCSAPHNAVTGRATSSRYGIDVEAWYKTETRRAYEVPDPKAWLELKANTPSVGARSEQKIGSGI